VLVFRVIFLPSWCSGRIRRFERLGASSILAEGTLKKGLTMSTICIIDVSDSMAVPNKSGIPLLKLAAEKALALHKEGAKLYVSSGSNAQQICITEPIRSEFLDKASEQDLYYYLNGARLMLMGGGIFITKAISYVSHYEPKPDTLIIITDKSEPVSTNFYKKNLDIITLGENNA
jgi:hypothetical protein